MKKIIFSYLTLVLLFTSCKEQIEKSPGTLYNEEFKWTIEIPENFERVSTLEWKKSQKIGADAFKDFDGKDVNNQTNQTKLIFMFKNADVNYIESCYAPFDTDVNGDYIARCKKINKQTYEMIKHQVPDASIDSSTTVEKISGLDFLVFKMTIQLPNEVMIKKQSYYRLFDKRLLSVNLMFLENKQSEKMISAWTNSKFE